MNEVTSPLATPSPRNFNLMVLGQIISILGSSLLRFALSLYVLDTTGRADIYATLYAVSNIPLLLAPLGGAIADRFNRRNLMVIFDFSSSMVVLALFLLMGYDRASIAVLGGIMVVLSIISALYTPAVTASIPLLVEHDKIEGANGIVQAVQALSSVAAPIIGALLYGFIGIRALVVLSATAFLLSAVMEIFIRIPYKKRPAEGHIVSTILLDMKDGFRYVMKKSFILKAMILAALLNLLLTPYFVVGGPIILRMTMDSSDTMYGIGMALINAATILGALSIGFFSKKMKVHTMYRTALIIAALLVPMAIALLPAFLNLGYYPAFLLFIACAIPIAMIMTMLSIFVIAKVQKVTPNENLGKVMAIIMAVAQCAAPLGQLIYGFLFEAFSASVFIPTLVLAVLMLGFSVFTRQITRNEKEPD